MELWLKGLSVMLEKIFGVRLISKLQAILLMEADFNAMNKEVYGIQMLNNAQQYKLIPEDMFSEQNCTADDGGLEKTLFYDITRQTRTPAAIASVDTSNCYDLIAHAMASRIFQSFGVESTAACAMLEMIQEMIFFLRTAYGDSKTFAGSSIKINLMKFPREEVTVPEMELWFCAIAQVVSHGPAQASLGVFRVNGHKLWEWRVVENRGRLYRQKGDQVEVYGHVQRGRYKNLCTSRSGKMHSNMATVE